ncbi:MAG: aldo/keto reductase [Chitinophagaceae bacterium]|jgi:aryl-alcohol dehydrogenase-like predicted oxidoreductase|nr:aldo/keto reductase [Chitinophagaceae bacterium]
MNYRKFGNTDLQVSEIGFGAWAIGGDAKVGDTPIGWGPADDNLSVKAIHAALDAGINFFDTADFYGLGHSEDLIGKVLRGHKEVIIATKVGHREIDQKIILDYSKDYIIEACEESLRRLKRDVIDYYQLHSARLNHLENGECIEAMQLLVKQGKIRYWGLSLNTFNPAPEAEWLIKNKWGNGLQLVFNLINQKAYDVMQQSAAAGYGIIARMPLQFGLLTGKITSGTTFDKNDHRSFRLTPEIISATLKVLNEDVWPMAEAEEMSKTSLALSFILSCKEVSTVIPGIRTPEHVKQNTSGLKKLSAKDQQRLMQMAGEQWKPVLEMMEKQG